MDSILLSSDSCRKIWTVRIFHTWTGDANSQGKWSSQVTPHRFTAIQTALSQIALALAPPRSAQTTHLKPKTFSCAPHIEQLSALPSLASSNLSSLLWVFASLLSSPPPLLSLALHLFAAAPLSLRPTLSSFLPHLPSPWRNSSRSSSFSSRNPVGSVRRFAVLLLRSRPPIGCSAPAFFQYTSRSLSQVWALAIVEFNNYMNLVCKSACFDCGGKQFFFFRGFGKG